MRVDPARNFHGFLLLGFVFRFSFLGFRNLFLHRLRLIKLSDSFPCYTSRLRFTFLIILACIQATLLFYHTRICYTPLLCRIYSISIICNRGVGRQGIREITPPQAQMSQTLRYIMDVLMHHAHFCVHSPGWKEEQGCYCSFPLEYRSPPGPAPLHHISKRSALLTTSNPMLLVQAGCNK